MSRTATTLTVLVFWTAAGPAVRAGLTYSGEPLAELPSQWRGFLLDQRALRLLATKQESPERKRYEDALKTLDTAARERMLTADESADRGALLVRLGDAVKAVEVLRAAQRQYPRHFRVVANLGTAYQLTGDLSQAAACLEEAVRLAPGKAVEAEKLHLRLVRLRLREPRGSQEFDDLFGVRYLGEGGRYQPGQLSAEERKKLPAEAVALVQQLALWLPHDARLLWQLAELAAAHGDVRTAAAVMDGCVTEFEMRSPELRRRRQLCRAAADEAARKADDGAKAAHEGHALTLKPRSSRPLANKIDGTTLPAIRATGVNALPWSVVNATTLDRRFKPTFAKYLQELDGKQVALTGFMQPLGQELELSSFMLIEYPVGCWYCEMPDVVGIVFVELPADTSTVYGRSLMKVEGKLTLNATDPENFLYTIGKAKVSRVE